nr:MAG TPA: hypothetical protein [Caudoviricetes sp.]
MPKHLTAHADPATAWASTFDEDLIAAHEAVFSCQNLIKWRASLKISPMRR